MITVLGLNVAALAVVVHQLYLLLQLLLQVRHSNLNPNDLRKSINSYLNILVEYTVCNCHLVYDLITIVDTATDSELELRQMAAFAYKLQRDMKVGKNCSRGSLVTYNSEGAEVKDFKTVLRIFLSTLTL